MYCRECGTFLREGARFCVNCGAPVQSPLQPGNRQRDAPPVPWQVDDNDSNAWVMPANSQMEGAIRPKRGRPAGATIALAFLFLALGFMLEVCSYIAVEMLRLPVKVETVLVYASVIGSGVGIVVLGGKYLLIPSKEDLITALKKGWWLLFTSFGLMVFSLISAVLSNEPIIEDGWIIRFFGILLLCVGIGLSEELSFRGLIFGSFLDACGKTRKGLYVAAILSAFLFGLAHIDWFGLDYLNPLSVVQALLKVVQTGTFGFFLAALVLRTKRIYGAALLHGLSDFILMLPDTVLLNGSTDVEYVSSGEEAVATIIVYVVFIALYVPLVVIGRKMIVEATVPDQGPLHSE